MNTGLRRCSQFATPFATSTRLVTSRNNPYTSSLTSISIQKAFYAAQTKQQLHPSHNDPYNSPDLTFPPPLDLPERGDRALPVHWFYIGRAFGKFYIAGVKRVWANHKSVKELRERVVQGPAKRLPRRLGVFRPLEEDIAAVELAEGSGLTRTQFQSLIRDRHDWGRIPVFGLLALVFGEWLPLLVPFIPRLVPKTCRIPSQVLGLRKVLEERRRASFRSGVKEPTELITGSEKAKPFHDGQKDPAGVASSGAITDRLSTPQLYHISLSLGLHSRLWDRLNMSPPTSVLKSAVKRRLKYLSVDDKLLKDIPKVQVLSNDEVLVASEERGIDVVGRSIESIRDDLEKWLANRRKDGTSAETLLKMLFRRPNTW